MFLLALLGFEKGDERDNHIGLFASRIAWVFTSVFLLIWSLQSFLHTGTLPVQFVIVTSSLVVFWASYLYYKRKLGG